MGMKRSQWRVILVAPYVLLLSWIRLNSSGYQGALGRIVPKSGSGMSAAEQLMLGKETAFALSVAVKFGPWWPRCLLRSLALGWFLARLGVPFEIRIGVPAGKGLSLADGPVDFSAHAWVEHDGVVLNDRKDIARDFVAFE